METFFSVLSIVLAVCLVIAGIWTVKELENPAVMDRNGNWIQSPKNKK